jgi:hypothetical protein
MSRFWREKGVKAQPGQRGPLWHNLCNGISALPAKATGLAKRLRGAGKASSIRGAVSGSSLLKNVLRKRAARRSRRTIPCAHVLEDPVMKTFALVLVAAMVVPTLAACESDHVTHTQTQEKTLLGGTKVKDTTVRTNSDGSMHVDQTTTKVPNP